MARNVTLAQLRADVQQNADIAGATTRHVATLLTRQLNQSIQRFRERLSVEGATHYLTATTGTLGTGATSPYSFYSLDLSAASPAIVRVFGVDITVNNEVRSLTHVPFVARNDYGGGSRSGVPTAWANYTTDKLAIMPPSASAYAYCVWYLPVLADLSEDSDTFDGVAGWEEAVTWDCVVKIINRDQYPNAYTMAIAYRNDLMRDILKSATHVNSAGGAVVGRDSMGERMLGCPTKPRLPPP